MIIKIKTLILAILPNAIHVILLALLVQIQLQHAKHATLLLYSLALNASRNVLLELIFMILLASLVHHFVSLAIAR